MSLRIWNSYEINDYSRHYALKIVNLKLFYSIPRNDKSFYYYHQMEFNS